MPKLKIHPSTEDGRIVHVTPKSAGWTYVGFDLWKLKPGKIAVGTDGDRETCLVLISGLGSVRAGPTDYGIIGERMSPFEGSPWSVYVPPNITWSVTATTDVVLAVCSAPAKGEWPPRIIPPGKTLKKFNIPYQSIDLITEDGIRLSAWYTPPRNGAVILLAHGYGDNRPEWVHELLAKKGYGVLAWDARAHGESDGEISTIGYLEVLDVKAALKYVLAQLDVKHVGAWGGSMGGAGSGGAGSGATGAA